MTSSTVCDSNTASLDYQEQKTFSSNHPSSWRNVLKDILVEWFEPENLYLSAIGTQIIATLLLKNRSYNFPGNKKKKLILKKQCVRNIMSENTSPCAADCIAASITLCEVLVKGCIPSPLEGL
jgi:hypothetical protein